MTSKISKFSWERVTLASGEMAVLNELCIHKFGLNQNELSKNTCVSISAISKNLKKLSQKGIIYCIEHPIKMYRIIPERFKEITKILTGYDFGKNKDHIIDAHNFVFEAEIKELPEKFLKKLTEHENWTEFVPNHWKGYSHSYIDGSVKFHKTGKRCTARFYFKTFAKNPYIAEAINTEKFLNKKLFLENKYPGLRIGASYLVAKCPWQEVALLRDPLSVRAIRLGIKHKNIEDSHRIGGEWEEKGPDAVDKIKKIIKFREIIVKLDKSSIEKLLRFAAKLEKENVNTDR